MDEHLRAYRSHLIETENKLKEAYDKLVVTLAGGALGLSLAFLKDIVDVEKASHTYLLLSSWGLLILCLAAILGAISFGIEAHRRAVIQVDNGTIYQSQAAENYRITGSVLTFQHSDVILNPCQDR